MIVRPIRPNEREECIALWQSAFTDDEPAYFDRYFYSDPDWIPEFTQVVEVDGRLVSAVHIVKRTVRVGDGFLTMGGIANVATHPEFRLRGYAKSALKQAIGIMTADAMDISILFSGANELYAGEGFSEIETHDAVLEQLADRPFDFGNFKVRECTADDLEAVRFIYDEANASTSLAVQRDAVYWRNWLGFGGDPNSHQFYAAEIGGEICGYAAVENSTGPGPLNLLELCFLPNFEPCAANLVHSILGAAQHKQIRTSSHITAILAGQERGFAQVSAESYRNMMVKFLQPNNLLRGLIPRFANEWIARDSPKGTLAIGFPTGTMKIIAGELGLEVAEESADSDILSQAQFFHLLVGGSNALEQLPKSQKSLAESLFSPGNCQFWPLDAF